MAPNDHRATGKGVYRYIRARKNVDFIGKEANRVGESVEADPVSLPCASMSS